MDEDIKKGCGKIVMLKAFGKTLIDLSSISKWIVYQKKVNDNYTLYAILKERGVCYKYEAVKNEEGEYIYLIALPNSEKIIFGKGEKGYEELETFGYVFL